jgi:membrane-associated phospholipid phosphatase
VRPVDTLLACWIGFVTLLIVGRGGVGQPTWWLVGAHALFALLLVLFTRLEARHRIGRVLHDIYPLLLLGALYTELGLLSIDHGVGGVLQHDLIVQGWEERLFGAQVSYTWIRTDPSVFWSGLLHFAYLLYYPIIYLAPAALMLTGRREGARNVILATMAAFVLCYIVFALFPVAGPNYAFTHPTGPVREVWSARLVYGILDAGSAIGTAFPSSHVAATAAAVVALREESPSFFAVALVPAILLVVSTVYCQMHYAVDVIAGVVVTAIAVAATRPFRVRRSRHADPPVRLAFPEQSVIL